MSNSDDSAAEDAVDQDVENGVGDDEQHLVAAVQLAVSQLEDNGNGDHEPPTKRSRTDDSESEMVVEQSIKQILFNINKAICLRLDSIENKLETVNFRTKLLDEKVEMLSQQVKLGSPNMVVSQSNTNVKRSPTSLAARRSSAVIVGLPQEPEKSDSGGSQSSTVCGMDSSIQSLGPNVTLITLNTEDDYPHGCWLGDDTNPEMRVRVPITPSDLLHVHSNCRTAEKMALTLLDYLFDRDTQASSNLSGMGKHGKKQLDPLMVYGIRCHLIHKFGISEQDWHRIKQNIDSKCRTAFRRRSRGMPLTVQGDVDMHQPVTIQGHHGEILQPGEIQVLHATPEQVAQLQQSHQIQHIQILQAGDQHLQQNESQDGIHVAVSMANADGIQVVSTETGETVNVPLTQEVSE